MNVIKHLATACLLLLPFSSVAKDDQWLTNMDQAQEAAKAEGKDIFMFYTGSDWCYWCIVLEGEVLTKPAFLEYARDNLILVELDFPADEEAISEQQWAHNERWREKYPPKGYPTVYLTDGDVKRYAQTGYRRGGEQAYVEHLQQLKQNAGIVADAMAKADAATDLQRAQYLDKALSAEGGFLEDRKRLNSEVYELSAANAQLRRKYRDVVGNDDIEVKLSAVLASREDNEKTYQALYSLWQEYQDLRSGDSFGMLLSQLGIYGGYVGKREWVYGFYEGIVNDDSYAMSIRQAMGQLIAQKIAEAEGIEKGMAYFDVMSAMNPDVDSRPDRARFLAHLENLKERGIIEQ